MDKRLIQAAKEGDVDKLHNLIKDDPFLLRAAALVDDQESPLHIACIGGHVDFVKEVLNQRPEFAKELNQDGLSPLHIASAGGDIEIVKELILKIGCQLCLVKGREKRIPLHFAVAKGRVEVIRELLSASADSIRELTVRGETCFHLAVKNSKFEAFEALFEHLKEDVLNKKDEQGNTILHLAASRKQYEVIDLLLDEKFAYKSKLEVNSLNKKGLTPLDVLISEGGDSEIEEMLSLAVATRLADMNPFLETSSSQNSSQNQSVREHGVNRPKSASKRLQEYFKYDKINESPSKARNTLLVLSVLIVTATYQAVLSPPGGVWQDNYWPHEDAKNTTSDGSSTKPLRPPRHTAGQAVMGTHNSVSYGLFLLFNSIGFFMSLHMMNFLTFGLPMQFELRVALFALTATYDACMVAITPSGKISVLFIVMSVVMPVMMPLLTKVVRDYKKGTRRELPDTNVVSSA